MSKSVSQSITAQFTELSHARLIDVKGISRMDLPAIGYDRDLFVLPFDHRSSFEAGLLGVPGRQLDAQEVEQLAAYKRIIYDGFLEALEKGVPAEVAAILVDQKYGETILADANNRHVITCAPVEKAARRSST